MPRTGHQLPDGAGAPFDRECPLDSPRRRLSATSSAIRSFDHRDTAFHAGGASDTQLLAMLADWELELDALLDRVLASDLGRGITRLRQATAAHPPSDR